MNEILSLEVNGSRICGVDEIKDAIADHFQRHFAARGVKPIPANMNFKTVEGDHSKELVREFSEDKVRKAIWECDSSKSPGPDGVNFGVVNEFWENIKDDFLRMVAEFYTNVVFSKGQIVRLWR